MTWRDVVRDAAFGFAHLACGVAAVPVALLPRRHWESFPRLPVVRAAVPSALVTAVVGLYTGVRGFMAYAWHAADAINTVAFEAAARQLQSPGSSGPPVTTMASQSISALSPFAFVLATPLGWLASYLVISGAIRAVTAGVDDPMGDPLLTGIDAFANRRRQRARADARRRDRERLEGPEVADRLVTGESCGFSDADVVLISSRRKPDWDRGTIVVTPDGWYRLADPLDIELPQGLRTAYPLAKLETPDVLRRSVRYTLPAVQRAPLQLRRR